MKPIVHKSSLLIFSILCMLFFPSVGHTQPHHPAAAVQNKARHVMKRTAVVLYVAHKHVQKNKNYTGDLSRAVAHQRFAKKMMRRKRYRRAIAHSRFARTLAFKAIKANKGTVKKEWEFTGAESAGADAPSNDALDKEMRAGMPGVSFKDEDIVTEPLKEVDPENIPNSDYK